mmetsp:Transcript_3715/g.4079  ORF Transcript_3715/g.4079 Transcript_3715/m.4079 type:complete len:297 (+) Transcript_3715:901-1791(+)
MSGSSIVSSSTISCKARSSDVSLTALSQSLARLSLERMEVMRLAEYVARWLTRFSRQRMPTSLLSMCTLRESSRESSASKQHPAGCAGNTLPSLTLKPIPRLMPLPTTMKASPMSDALAPPPPDVSDPLPLPAPLTVEEVLVEDEEVLEEVEERSFEKRDDVASSRRFLIVVAASDPLSSLSSCARAKGEEAEEEEWGDVAWSRMGSMPCSSSVIMCSRSSYSSALQNSSTIKRTICTMRTVKEEAVVRPKRCCSAWKSEWMFFSMNCRAGIKELCNWACSDGSAWNNAFQPCKIS